MELSEDDTSYISW